MKMNHITQLGFLFGLHPTLSSCDNMKESLDPYMDNIEYNLIPAFTFYINEKGKCVKTQVTKLQVDSVKVNKVCDSIASTWLDPNFLEVLSTLLISQSIEFIPYPKKGLMAVEIFCSAIHQQYEFNNNTIAISIVGIRGLKVEVTCHGNKKTLVDLVHSLRDEKGNPVFNSIEPMKFTATEGHWLFITQKLIVEEAKKLINNLFEQLALEGLLDAFMMEGHKIRCINQTQLKCLSQYAKGLAAKFKPMPMIMIPTLTPATPAHNTWKCTPTFKFDQENFLDIGSPSHTHTAKKQHHSTEDDDTALQQMTQSQQTLATAMTNKCTEFVQNLTDNFTNQLNLIKKDHQEQQKKREAHIKEMDEAITKLQEQLLTEFKNMMTNYNNAQVSYTNLHNDFQNQCLIKDHHYHETQNSMAQMMQILINMNQSLTDGTKPTALSPEQIKEMCNSTHGQYANTQVSPPPPPPPPQS